MDENILHISIEVIIWLNDNILFFNWCYHLMDHNIDFIIWLDDNFLFFIHSVPCSNFA